MSRLQLHVFIAASAAAAFLAACEPAAREDGPGDTQTELREAGDALEREARQAGDELEAGARQLGEEAEEAGEEIEEGARAVGDNVQDAGRNARDADERRP